MSFSNQVKEDLLQPVYLCRTVDSVTNRIKANWFKQVYRWIMIIRDANVSEIKQPIL